MKCVHVPEWGKSFQLASGEFSWAPDHFRILMGACLGQGWRIAWQNWAAIGHSINRAAFLCSWLTFCLIVWTSIILTDVWPGRACWTKVCHGVRQASPTCPVTCQREPLLARGSRCHRLREMRLQLPRGHSLRTGQKGKRTESGELEILGEGRRQRGKRKWWEKMDRGRVKESSAWSRVLSPQGPGRQTYLVTRKQEAQVAVCHPRGSYVQWF